jgi:hypothetical protein
MSTKRRNATKTKDVEPFQPIDVISPPNKVGGNVETDLPPLDEAKEGLVHKAPHVEIPDADPPRD